jgi:hypothetical protein
MIAMLLVSTLLGALSAEPPQAEAAVLRLRDRADYIASRATSSIPHASRYEYSELRVRVLGCVVIVTGRGATTGEGVAFEARFTDVWAQREGRWQLVAIQRTDIAQ